MSELHLLRPLSESQNSNINFAITPAEDALEAGEDLMLLLIKANAGLDLMRERLRPAQPFDGETR